MNDTASQLDWYDEIHGFITTSREELKKKLHSKDLTETQISWNGEEAKEIDRILEEEEPKVKILETTEDKSENTEESQEVSTISESSIVKNLPQFCWTGIPYQISDSLAGKESYSSIQLTSNLVEISGNLLVANLQNLQFFLLNDWNSRFENENSQTLRQQCKNIEDFDLKIWPENQEKCIKKSLNSKDINLLLNEGLLNLNIDEKEAKKNNIKIGSYLNFLLKGEY